MPIQAKIDLLGEIDRIARAYDPRITKVMASVASENRLILVATSEGWLVGDTRPLCRLHVTCIAEDTRAGERQTGRWGRSAVARGRSTGSFSTESAPRVLPARPPDRPS